MTELLGQTHWQQAWEVARLVVDFVLVYYIIYRMLLLIKGTQAVQMLFGLTIIFGLFILSKEEHLNLGMLNWVLDKFIGAFIFIVIVIFQNDIRRALAQVGKSPLFRASGRAQSTPYLEDVVQAASQLSQKKIGFLLALEREAKLDEYADNGVSLDSVVTHQTLQSIFIPFKQNPLHDGAVVVRDGRIVAARCILPFSTNPAYKHLGSRHRAALGLSELTDAIVVVVSEETGSISMADHGDLTTGLDVNSLRLRLTQGYSHDVSEVRQVFRRGESRLFRRPDFMRRKKKKKGGS